MFVSFILDKFRENKDKLALITEGKEITYNELIDSYEMWMEFLEKNNVKNNSIIAVKGEFNSSTIGLMLAILNKGSIYVPLSNTLKNIERYLEIAEVEYYIEDSKIRNMNENVTHEILNEVKNRKSPGLILFSSGTTGEPKAAVHDLVPMLEKYKKSGKPIKSMAFLLFDHIGGFNTVMYSISNGGTLITLKERTVEEVCKVIEKYKVEVLPTSPSFINMMLYSRVYEKYDISSLEMVTYGTEPMPQYTLERFHELFPNVTLKQTYGLSELGIMRTKSENSKSLWLKLGDDEHQTDIRNGVLWIKTDMAMLGYLNAPSPFDKNGWFNTKDKVKVKGEYIKILGRESELINVGGEKVYPAEVESVILEVCGVKDVIVNHEANTVLGNIVVCSVSVEKGTDQKEMKKLIKKHCNERLEKYKRPVKIYFIDEGDFSTNRFKRKR